MVDSFQRNFTFSRLTSQLTRATHYFHVISTRLVVVIYEDDRQRLAILEIQI